MRTQLITVTQRNSVTKQSAQCNRHATDSSGGGTQRPIGTAPSGPPFGIFRFHSPKTGTTCPPQLPPNPRPASTDLLDPQPNPPTRRSPNLNAPPPIASAPRWPPSGQSRGCHCGRQDRRVRAVRLGKMFVSGPAGGVFASGSRWRRSGAEGGAGAGGELTRPLRAVWEGKRTHRPKGRGSSPRLPPVTATSTARQRAA